MVCKEKRDFISNENLFKNEPFFLKRKKRKNIKISKDGLTK